MIGLVSYKMDRSRYRSRVEVVKGVLRSSENVTGLNTDLSLFSPFPPHLCPVKNTGVGALHRRPPPVEGPDLSPEVPGLVGGLLLLLRDLRCPAHLLASLAGVARAAPEGRSRL